MLQQNETATVDLHHFGLDVMVMHPEKEVRLVDQTWKKTLFITCVTTVKQLRNIFDGVWTLWISVWLAYYQGLSVGAGILGKHTQQFLCMQPKVMKLPCGAQVTFSLF